MKQYEQLREVGDDVELEGKKEALVVENMEFDCQKEMVLEEI